MSPDPSAGPAIAFLAGRDPTDEIGGGHSSYVRAVARAAVAAGFSPRLYCVSPRSGNETLGYGFVRRVDHRGRPCRQTRAGFHAPALVEAALRDAAEDGPPALIHSFGVWGYAGHVLQAGLRVAGASVPHLLSMYTIYEEESRALLRAASAYSIGTYLRQWFELQWIRTRVASLERQAVLGANAVLVNYESVRNMVTSRYAVASKILLVRYGPESAFVPGTGSSVRPEQGNNLLVEGLPLIVSVTLQKPKKGVACLLQALELVKKRGLPFRAFLVGGGPLLATHQEMAKGMGLEGSVSFAGLVPDVKPYLEAADIFVLPSLREESGSLALLEAMQARCAVISSGVDGLLEDIQPGVDGLLVEPGNSIALADAIAALIRSPDKRKQLAGDARRSFDRKFSAAAHTQALSAAYGAFGLMGGEACGD